MGRSDEQSAVREALAEVRIAALSCVACKLHVDRTQVVFGTGHANTPMVLVGQSPGEQEDQTGEPFVGRAGQLLTECLAECGIKRRHIWITNVVKCRPWERTERGRGRNRDPEEDEIQACRSWIEAELALITPLVIVCAGAQSAETILRRKLSITRDRGTWFVDHDFRPAQVIPVLHPAYIVRKQGQPEFDELRQQLIDDLDAARRMAARLRAEPPPAAAEPVAEPPDTSQPSLFDDAG